MILLGLMGRAGAGKDTVAAELVRRDGFRRVAFADPLKRMALAVDPLIQDRYDGVYRLSFLVERDGWESAKRDYPEVRRFLQRLGLEGVRETIADDTWLRLALRDVQAATDAGQSVVVTDVRFPNEAETLRAAGFRLAWVERPYVAEDAHASENMLTALDADFMVHNTGTAEDAYAQVRHWLLPH